MKPSLYYKREGINVFTKLDITPAQAVLGDTVTIRTLDGDREISIPAGIQTWRGCQSQRSRSSKPF